MERLLRGRGYEVQRAASKAEALESARRLPFHVLVSDIGLPDGSGLELMAELQKASPICAIAMSGFGTEADIKRSRDAGFLEHLVKPVDFDALVRVIRDKCTARAE
jgi:CheY-like chemotaxis protein